MARFTSSGDRSSLRRHAQRRRSWTGATQPQHSSASGRCRRWRQPAAAQAQTTRTAPLGGAITDVAGVKVGHFTDTRRPTGCTVLITEEGATAGVDVRGAAPGTRETDLLNPTNLVDRVHAIMLAGGSAFGLEAATGAVRFLEEKGIGFRQDRRACPSCPRRHPLRSRHGRPSHPPGCRGRLQGLRRRTTEAPAEGSVGAGPGRPSARPMASPAP